MPTVVAGSGQLSALVICTVLLEDSLQPAARSHHIQPHPTQTGPHGQLVCGQHRFVELALQRSNNVVGDRKSTRLNSSHASISYAVFCLKKKTSRGCSSLSRRRVMQVGKNPR